MPKARSDLLPVSIPAFRKIVVEARSDQAKRELADRCWSECRRAGVKLVKEGTKGSRSAFGLYESRMMEIVQSSLGRCDWEIWRTLIYVRSERFVDWLARQARNESEIGSELAQYLAWCAADRFIPLLIRLLKNGNARVTRGVAEGIATAAYQNRPSKKFRERMFEELRPLVDGSRDLGNSEAASDAITSASEAMISLDPVNAVAYLSSASCIHAKNKAIRQILLELHSHREDAPARRIPKIDPDLLWPLYELARDERLPGVKKGFHDQVAGLILTFTADQDPIRTRRECRAAIKAAGKGWSSLKDEANEALRRCKRVPEPEPALAWMDRHPGKLPRKAEEILRAYELASHVLTDGFPLYFHNLGTHWKPALAGLRTMHLAKAAKALNEGAHVFGAKGPPSTNREFQAAFESLKPAQHKKLDALGVTFDNLTSSIMTGVERYMNRNPDLFSRAFK